jgi:hypothetical protein
MLYLASGLVIFVILSIIFGIMPQVINNSTSVTSRGYSVPALWAITGVHLLILAVLIVKITLGYRSDRVNKIRLSIPGIILLLISLPLLEAGGAGQVDYFEMSGAAFLLALCVLFDILAGIIAIVLPAKIPEKQDK